MAGKASGGWNPEVGDRRQVRLAVEGDGSVSILEPAVTKTVDIRGEFEYPPETELDVELEIVERDGVIGVIAEPRTTTAVHTPDSGAQDGPRRQELIEELRRLAAEVGKTPTTHDIRDHGQFRVGEYHETFDSFIDALQEAKLQPTELQYRFSDRETPDELQRSPNVEYLREHGPSTKDELPKEFGRADKKHGGTYFDINNNVGSSTNVYYLMDEHDAYDVVQKFFEENPNVIENNTKRTLTSLSGNHGRSFKKAAQKLAPEYKDGE